ncbi:TetR/AcrR family transcriptional regulator [Sphingobium subterraneum]|uniref:AcrR family transcriptional regulator n=1 Tax=Sphingobium subterraneum TaxID=627688 RepID=A0A841IVQ8_9SPHN|nr:TetR/AcrR family transcriptional regulator [Sphingobium subterraneum]MBB6122737.1 AcrR family transcriptional regulator [Sphingobium subterraneum]
MNEAPVNLKARTRRIIQNEIADTAKALFAKKGYGNTTVEDIAAVVGMSQRTIFRYFTSKEDILLGKFDYVAGEMLDCLRSRPTDEPAWDSLREMLGSAVYEADGPDHRSVAESIHIVFDNPALFASYLQKLQPLQGKVIEILIERAKANGKPYAVDDPAPYALAAAAFGCFVAAQCSWDASGAKRSFAEALGRAMATLIPA